MSKDYPEYSLSYLGTHIDRAHTLLKGGATIRVTHKGKVLGLLGPDPDFDYTYARDYPPDAPDGSPVFLGTEIEAWFEHQEREVARGHKPDADERLAWLLNRRIKT